MKKARMAAHVLAPPFPCLRINCAGGLALQCFSLIIAGESVVNHNITNYTSWNDRYFFLLHSIAADESASIGGCGSEDSCRYDLGIVTLTGPSHVFHSSKITCELHNRITQNMNTSTVVFTLPCEYRLVCFINHTKKCYWLKRTNIFTIFHRE